MDSLPSTFGDFCGLSLFWEREMIKINSLHERIIGRERVIKGGGVYD